MVTSRGEKRLISLSKTADPDIPTDCNTWKITDLPSSTPSLNPDHLPCPCWRGTRPRAELHDGVSSLKNPPRSKENSCISNEIRIFTGGADGAFRSTSQRPETTCSAQGKRERNTFERRTFHFLFVKKFTIVRHFVLVFHIKVPIKYIYVCDHKVKNWRGVGPTGHRTPLITYRSAQTHSEAKLNVFFLVIIYEGKIKTHLITEIPGYIFFCQNSKCFI